MQKLNHLVLAEGEVTGHAHRASAGTLYSDTGRTVLVAEDETVVTHEEHHQTPRLIDVIPGGRIVVQRVQEFNHAEQEASDVAD